MLKTGIGRTRNSMRYHVHTASPATKTKNTESQITTHGGIIILCSKYI